MSKFGILKILLQNKSLTMRWKKNCTKKDCIADFILLVNNNSGKLPIMIYFEEI